MFCEHGFISESCPHCHTQTGIKPLIRLVKPAPREIPVPVPRKEQFLNRNSESMDQLHEPHENIRSIPQKPGRNFNLRESTFKPRNSLFHNKRVELQGQKNTDQVLHNSDIKLKIENIEDQFFEEK